MRPASATHDGVAHAQPATSCDVYPIGVSAATLADVHPGGPVDDLTAGAPKGHQGWLTWDGDIDNPSLVTSLTPPGDSSRYVDPDDPSDHVLSTGDWARARPGVTASSGLRAALGKLYGKRIDVPVWDRSRGTGSNVAYHVSRFATVTLTGFDTSHGAKLAGVFVGYSDCGAPQPGPTAQPTSAKTLEDTPVQITLAATGSRDLTFDLATPGHGAVATSGAPSCRTTTTTGSTTSCTLGVTYRPAADFHGPDSFTFTVSDSHTDSVPATVTIDVSEVNDPPIAGADSADAPHGSAQVDASTLLLNDVPGPADESDQKLTVTSVDASADTHGTVSLTNGTVRYVADRGFTGVARFRYVVTDDGTTAGRPDPRSAVGTVTVAVTAPVDHPPVADPASVTLAEDTPTPIALTGSDPDGDALTFAIVSAPTHGTLTGTAPNLVYTPSPDFVGADSFTFAVTAVGAGSTPAVVSLTVTEVNDPPVPGDDEASGKAGVDVSLPGATLLANDLPGPANESGQTLTLTNVAAGPTTHGTVSLSGTTVTYSPDPGFAGAATFTYTVCDDGTTDGKPDPRCSDRGHVTVQLAAPNRPPVAAPTSVTTAEDVGVPVTLTASDPDGDPLTFVASAPPNGSLSGTAPHLVYTPAPNYFGTDSFTFTASDGHGTSEPATVDITVTEVNDAPYVGPDALDVGGRQPTAISAARLLANDATGPSNESTQTLTVASVQGGPATHGTVTFAHGVATYAPELGYSGPASFTYTACDNGTTDGRPDPLCTDGTVALTVAPVSNAVPVADTRSPVHEVEDTAGPLVLSGDDPDGDRLSFAVVSLPQHGTLSGTAPDLVYTPAPDYFGPDQLTFTTSDGLATSEPVALPIVVSEVNDPPVPGADSIGTVAGRPMPIPALSLVANDVSGPPNEAGQTLTVTKVRAGDAHGTVVLVAGTVTYVPEAAYEGTASFSYTVCDDGTTAAERDPQCADGTVSVSVVAPDRPPVADPQSLTVAEDTDLPVTLTGSDPDGDPITYAIAIEPAHGHLSGTAPALTYKPDADYNGPDSFTFVTHDGALDSTPETVKIDVTEVNDPPVVNNDDFTLGGAGTLPPTPEPHPCDNPCGVLWGDPHAVTFDGETFHLQPVGEVIAAKSTTDDFEVQARLAPWPGSRTVARTTALAMRVAGHRVGASLTSTDVAIEVRVDGAALVPGRTPSPLPGGGSISSDSPDEVSVVWPDGSVAIVEAGTWGNGHYLNLQLGPAAARRGHLVGVLGDADGERANDMTTRDGRILPSPVSFDDFYKTYVMSWRIAQSESLFDYAPGESTTTLTDLTFPDGPTVLSAADRARAEGICSKFGLSADVLDACVTDVGVTGDAGFATDAAQAQAAGLGIPTNAGTTAIGTPTTVTTTVADENATRTFTGTAGQQVTMAVSGNTFAQGVWLNVISPSGSTVASQYATGATAFHDVFTLPVTGTYTVQIDPQGQQVGSVTFVLRSVADNAGTTAIGTPTTVATTTVGENPTRTFTGSSGQQLTMSVSGNNFSQGVWLTVLNPSGSTVANVFATGATAFRDVFTLPVTGTYTVEIDPQGEQVGSVTFLLRPVNANSGTAAIGTATTVATTSIGENATRTFTGTAGQQLTIAASGNTFSQGVWLTVLNPTGSTVANLFVTGATGFRDAFTLPVTGTYTVEIDPQGEQTGSVTFLLRPVASNTGTTAVGTATTVTTTTIGENATRTFTGTAGQQLTIAASGNTFSQGVWLTVLNPTGSTVANLFVTGATGFRDVFTLPVTGTYTVEIDPQGEQTGSVTFLLRPVASNTGTTTVGTATTVTTTTIGENATRTFTGTAGQQLTIAASGNTFSQGVWLTVLNPTGSTVANLYVTGATGFRDVFTLPVTGTYTVEIDPQGEQTGSVTFLLRPVASNTGTTAVGTATTVTTTTIGENATRTFTGTAGQQLTLSASGNTFSQGVWLTVLNPTGSTVANLFATGATAFRAAFTLPVTGTYTLDVDPQGEQTGSVTFLLAAATPGAAQAVGLPSLTASDSAPPGTAMMRTLSAAGLTAAAAPNSLTFTVTDLLANDRPGPENESSQKLTITSVNAGPSAHGTASLADGQVTYTPEAAFLGRATVEYTACDDGTTDGRPDPRCSTGTVTINVTANHPPTLQVPEVTTAEDTSVAVPLTATDPEGDPVTFVVAGAPAHGTLTGTPPNLVYSPAPNTNGVDSFTVLANDGHDQSRPATVSVTVTPVNDPPVPQPDKVTARPGRPADVPTSTLVANDEPGPADERGQRLTVTAVTPGPDTHGTATLASGVVTYTPDAGYGGASLISYTVCDDGATDGVADPRCADSTLSIVANRPPTAIDQTVRASLTQPLPITLTGDDPDGDPLTFAVPTPPTHGTLTGTPPTLTYVADAGFVGGDTFTFTAADATGTSAPATVSIAVSDIPPPALHPDTAGVRPGHAVVVDVLGNDNAASGALDPATLTITTQPARGNAVVALDRIRYTADAGASGVDTFGYTVCDTGGGCATSTVTVTISDDTAPVAADDTYDVAVGATLHPVAPGVLGNDSDADPGDTLQARLVRGVTDGTLLLMSTGAFTYTPNGPGVDSFVYHVVDQSGAVSRDATVTIYATGPPGPPVVGNDRYDVQSGRDLHVPAPGLLENDYSPSPRVALQTRLERDVTKGTLLLQPDGSFVYTPAPGAAGTDQFTYTVRDSEGRVSAEAHVGLTITPGGPPTATVAARTPADGTVVHGPTDVTATLTPPPGETVTGWTVSSREPGSPDMRSLGHGAGNDVHATFDPTLVSNGTYELVVRAETSGGGVLVDEVGVAVEGDYKPGRYRSTYRDVSLNAADIPIDLDRTYDSTGTTSGDLGPGWSLKLAGFRIETNGSLGAGPWTRYTCGGFPFYATCYQSAKPHVVTVTWPDGHLERFRFEPDRGSPLVPTITTPGFVAEPGTTSRLQSVGPGLVLAGGDFLAGDFFSADGVFDPMRFVLTAKDGTQYLLDRREGLLQITDRNGNTVTLGSDGVQSSSGLSLTFQRDATDRITGIVGPGGTTRYSYDARGDLVRVDYPDGTDQTFTYDDHHGLLTVSGGGKLVRTVHYDSDGRAIAVTDGDGNTTSLASNVGGRQQIVTDAAGRLTTVYTYDDRGDVVRKEDTFGGRTVTRTATYDSRGQLLTATDPLGNTSTWTYDGAGNILSATDPNGLRTTYTYNTFGQPLTTTNAVGATQTSTYDEHGNLLSTTSPTGGVTSNSYDAAGRMVATVDPNGNRTTVTYDGAGNVTSVTDGLSQTTRQDVQPSTGFVTAITRADGSSTRYSYGKRGDLTQITDGDGHSISGTYDDFGRLLVRTDSAGRESRFTYDLAGNLTAADDRNGDRTTFAYDKDSRLVQVAIPGSGTIQYEFDALGRETSISNSNATLLFTHDDADRLLSAKTVGSPGSGIPTSLFEYAYNADGQVTSTNGPGGRVDYSYGRNGKVASVRDPAGGEFTFTYDAAKNLLQETRPNAVDDSLSYDAAQNLTKITSRLNDADISQIAYAYDPNERRDARADGLGQTRYRFDAAGRLTGATYPPASGLHDDSFAYDAAGNRTSSTSHPDGSYSYDANDRMTTDGQNSYTYDNEGNLLSSTDRVSGATTTYSWNALHQLIAVERADGAKLGYRYDPLGRLVQTTDGRTSRSYAFDQTSMAAEYDGSGNLSTTFVHTPDSSNRALEMVQGPERYYYLSDAQQSTTKLVTPSGQVAEDYQYSAFGAVVDNGAVDNPFQFAGQFHDASTGLVLHWARPYDPSSGRFLSEDPVPSTNPYTYALNDPVNHVDPVGLATTEYSITKNYVAGKSAETSLGIFSAMQIRILSITGTATYRMLDALENNGIIEFKDVAYQHLSSQLTDMILYAQAVQVPFYLLTRLDTVLSGPLQELIDEGIVLWIPTL